MEEAERLRQGLWERLSAERQEDRRPRLTHRRIAEAAFEIADTEGLDAVTMRRVAKELGAATMSLYRYVESKEELHELLLDEAVGRMGLPERRTGDWRADLRELAVRQLAEFRRRPWIITLQSATPTFGPNTLQTSEYAMSLLDGLGFTIDEMMQIFNLVRAHVTSLVRAERQVEAALQRAGLDEEQWQAAHAPYLRELMSSGRYPYLERIIAEAEHLPVDTAFEFGLEILLDGVAARLSR
ncbi:TetR/AcrR family transcriptional regulator [Sphaerisporangium fuscum]|uniref:TetR/AcrR family transcriptional regulator n=1 Tax=Sphaerisporangium fuscum TaxID=2835868 RepID=UPI001BDBFADB|nr:TetR/AcrR family transcriptional regulator [Sphaerisporangium fuscum]